MKCPYCEGEMKRGFIRGEKYSLKWVPEEKKNAIFLSLVKGIKLSNLYDTDGVESFCCENCKKILIDIEDKIDQQK
ncbi:hypothetical protein KQI86_08450 [Clostridium sp. MSJ-11]|uniref:DUF6487 domain-containing protein n=1 Tax=Clostridium mobile TaxID=2841512 RepID=A0ABS6EHY2_9CLOT|nr:PF20097 family protein [Clostridium mobile]MBU5484357.1 hypothetical protein [Clostridium mobile]